PPGQTRPPRRPALDSLRALGRLRHRAQPLHLEPQLTRAKPCRQAGRLRPHRRPPTLIAMRLLSLALRLTALFAAFAATATAQLVFKTDTVKTTAKAGDATVETRFPFTNRGQDVVNITELGSTCGCTVPELKTRRYAPGESGEITTRFTIGNRTGKQTSHITVKTDAGPQLLTLEIDIPPRINTAPHLL